MAQRMLIDTTHPEETRVAVVSGNRLDDLDFETSTKKQLKGNIYLARVVRVEPSLQACFVDYGGNRHGFLAFSEIHPDYYRIPVSDREALLAEQAAAARAEEEELEAAEAAAAERGRGATAAASAHDDGEDELSGDDLQPGLSEPETVHQPIEVTEVGGFQPAALDETPEAAGRGALPPVADLAPDEAAPSEFAPLRMEPVESTASEPYAAHDRDAAPAEFGYDARRDLPAEGHDESRDNDHDDHGHAEDDDQDEDGEADDAEGGDAETGEAENGESDAGEVAEGEVRPQSRREGRGRRRRGRGRDRDRGGDRGGDRGDHYDSFGGDAVDELPRRRSRPLRNYKIQEVIKRRQIMLVQVVKEERGNKGAALTTYLSLAGRYCVLMPNTTRGGGVSRKITNATDRRRLKSLLDELDLPQGMAVIVRTAGSERSRAEVKRDCDYLMRLWDEIREMTLKSTAPCLIYEEASLIKRAIRDLYARDIDEVLVEGEEGYRAAKDFMKMLMPSHAKRVQHYQEDIPLFHRYQIESQIDAMHSPSVQLRSGGYIVINPTEALVAIDVNSGRATRERFIEETALRTNLEAAEEVGRQLRLRDLGGLIVIDFIDMEDHRNNHAVERRLKEALRFDRARIQVGRISPFGLLELSRQRLRPSFTETSTLPCPHCAGTGLVRSTESAALHVLRAIEDEGIRRRSREIVVHVATPIALYILNEKRQRLSEIERRYGFSVMVSADNSLLGPDYRLERLRAATSADSAAPIRAESVLPSMADDLPDELEEIEPDAALDDEDGEERERQGGDRHEAREGGQRENGREGHRRDGEEGEGGRRRRRRRRGRGRDREADDQRERAAGEEGDERRASYEGEERPYREQEDAPRRPLGEGGGEGGNEDGAEGGAPSDQEARDDRGEGEDGERRRRRRGRRGGRRRGRRGEEGGIEGQEGAPDGAPAMADGDDRGLGGAPTRFDAGDAPTRFDAGDAPAWPHDPADVKATEPQPVRAESGWPLSHEHDASPRQVEPESAPAAAATPVAAEPVVPAPVAAAPVSAPAPAPVKEPRSSVADNLVVVDESTPKPASGRKGWWQRLTNG